MHALTPYEIATGFPLGGPSNSAQLGQARAPWQQAGGALEAFESVVLGALRRTPCVVQFSGGRDSSAVLGVATDLARRHGLELPVPHTIRFAGQDEAGEDAWQEVVVRHLGLPEWVRTEAGDDADLLGPAARGVLLRHGVIWSPALATRSRYAELAKGGSLLTGEGGDEVLGRRRSAPLSALVGASQAHRVGRAAHQAKAALGELMPRPLRVRRARRQLAARLGLEWLRQGVRETYLAQSAQLWSAEPLVWGRAVQWVTSCRHVRLGLENMVALAAEAGAEMCAPFLHPNFVSALPAAFGPLGPRDRTMAMRALFGGLLPEELLSRRTKAVFTVPAWGPRTREFVADWKGNGVDLALVDVEALRRHWAGPRPSAMSFCLLHAAWLAEGARP